MKRIAVTLAALALGALLFAANETVPLGSYTARERGSFGASRSI
jgi:hypothetical protein